MCQAVLGVRDTVEIKSDAVLVLWGSQSSEGSGDGHVIGQFQSRLIRIVPKLEASWKEVGDGWQALGSSMGSGRISWRRKS